MIQVLTIIYLIVGNFPTKDKSFYIFAFFQRTGRVILTELKTAESLVRAQGECTPNQVYQSHFLQNRFDYRKDAISLRDH